ncbi:hypothetical protein BU25DRAFT_385118 [Macroventuria anomochaeta]|uniref:Uncharacterized protein n=1 Tax=Macroventuria anomochaeta TaxID=301207 RepID=A0ACB6SEX7_9PLEO|nr:uncharacterized protein BU25DRAFT_385118 [Macroventuria anomochaeta]KAF2631642.1 hypothetical protein BU25DRAFT_385118 [Macroventuria anomochaeta]
MSACSNTLRALSRSCIPTNKTLLPFLYQTATIQQWKPAAQPIARRNISRYSRKDDPSAEDIPFENKEELPPALDDLEPARKTTITGSERAAFEKLYRKFNTRGSRQNEKDHEVEIDAIADEYWEPDEEEEDPKASLDKIFDDALKGKAKSAREWNRSGTEQLRSRKSKQDLQSMAEHVLKGTRPLEMRARELRAKKKKDTSAQAAKLNEARLRERNRIDALLTSAKTDRELWETLQREVFDQVRQLDLDSTAPKPKRPARNAKSTSTTTTVDPKILFTNYPHHLLTALTTLRTHFPASPLPLSILPTIKSLGRSSYALGATTALYTTLLRTAWLQQSSYPLLTSLLTDMHNGAIEFSVDTLALLDQVIREFDMARSGRLGREMQMVYGMEQFGEGIREVRRWRQVVAERVGADDGRREKGTVPVPRRRRVVDDGEAVGDHVPLVEGMNGAPEQSPGQVERVDPAVEFGFLSEESGGEAARADEPDGVPAEAAEKVEEKLQDEVKDDIKEEEDRTADKSEAAAKTSTGEPVPWTPS